MNTEQALPAYKILVLGANGGIGRQCVEIALQAGYHVTALLRDPSKLPLMHPNLNIVKGDIMQPDTFEKHVADKDTVISAIGTSGGFGADKPTTLYSIGNHNLLQAMQNYGVNRAFFISASAIEISPVLPFYVRWAAKYIIQKLLKHMYADLRVMEKLVKESHTSWTIIRPPRLKDEAVTGKYRVGINRFLENALSISRGDVAHFIVHNLNNPELYQATVEIAY